MTAPLSNGSRIYREWLRRIERGAATMAECRQFAAVQIGRGRRTNLTGPEASDLYDRLQTSPVLVGGRDHTRAAEWMARWGAKRLGLPADLPRQVCSFHFAGEAIEFTTSTCLPVWRADLFDGRSFDYYAASWQAQAFVHSPHSGPYVDPEGWWWHVGGPGAEGRRTTGVLPVMGQDCGCVYDFDGMDDGLEMWRCTAHGDISIGSDVPCETGQNLNPPAPYRGAS